TKDEIYTAYINHYHKAAREQQKKHGIPASITLAQGLLESAAGRSELAVKANNHFGVKCTSDWKGASYRHDDETKDECFRSYRHAEESYEDHSLFLLRPRYKTLFELPLSDYKGWAHGLKRCGYATDPAYAAKLIRIIEEYNLTQYVGEDAKSGEENSEKENINEKVEPENNGKEKEIADINPDSFGKSAPSGKSGESAPSAKSSKKAKREKQLPPPAPVKQEQDPDEVVSTALSANRKLQAGMGSVTLAAEHEVKRNNGRRYIVARQGDTFESLAFEYNIYESMLRRYNDIVNPRYQLQAGDKVYLQPKRSRAEKKYAKYYVKKDENIWQIAQDKGMRLKTIYRLNGIREGQNVTVNQELRLR
ncbi:MAG: glucosaminidase domain-containing protein, partial [Paludibacteraceae bacterium]|nr:glucosaminidase domain-containing protein [Paludibacteraceae bacterium]